jgi:hypothetical protein
MSDQPQHPRDATRPNPGRYTVEDPPWARRGGAEPVYTVKVDRPLHTGMMFGFGLMVAGIVLVVIMSIVVAVMGLVLGGPTAANL